MIVKFWGVRGSYPTSRADVLKYGGNTSCVSVQIDDKLLVIDAGSGVRLLGEEIDARVKDVYFHPDTSPQGSFGRISFLQSAI